MLIIEQIEIKKLDRIRKNIHSIADIVAMSAPQSAMELREAASSLWPIIFKKREIVIKSV